MMRAGGNLPSDDKHLVLDSHGLYRRGELLVSIIGEEAEVLHFVRGGDGRTRDLTVLGLDGDCLVKGTTGLGRGVVDRDGNGVLLYHIGLEAGIGDSQRADCRGSVGRSGRSSRDGGARRDRHAQSAGGEACSRHIDFRVYWMLSIDLLIDEWNDGQMRPRVVRIVQALVLRLQGIASVGSVGTEAG